MPKGKFSKVLSVVLSASMLVGGLPLFGGGKASAETGSTRVLDNLIQLNSDGGYLVTSTGGYASWGRSIAGYDKASENPEGEGKLKRPIVQMTSDSKTTYVQDTSGEIYYWGADKLQVGSSYNDVQYPEKVTDLSDVDQIQTYARSNLARKNGDLYLWGALSYNVYPAKYNTSTPTKIELPERVKKAQFASNKTLILLESGELGYINSNTPTFTSLGQGKFKDFWSGWEFTVALNEQDKLVVWRNADSLPTYRELTNTPTDIKQVSMGKDHFLVLRETGNVLSYGKNHFQYKQLGSTTNLETTQATNLLVEADRIPENIVYVSAGEETSLVVDEDGNAYVWGYNAVGNLGLGHKNTVGIPTLNPSLTVYTKAARPIISKPSNVIATTTDSSIALSWDAVEGAKSYTVTVNGTLAYNGISPKFTYTSGVAGTSYSVAVWANSSIGTQSDKVRLNVRTKEEQSKLPAPINFGTNVINKNSLVTSWNPVVGADKYTLVINGEVAYSGGPESTSQIFHDMLPNTTYVVEVFASRNGVDGERAISSSTTPEAEIKFEAPGTPTVNSTEAGNVKISWNATSGALVYKVFRNGVEVGSVSSPSYTDKNAVEGEAYLYTVRAFDGVKTSESSPFVLVTVTEKVTVPKAPSNPMNFKVVSDEHSVTTTWDAATGATEYKLVINGIEVYRGPNLTYTYSNLPEKTEYRVEITAINAFGESGTQLFTIKTKDPKKLPAAKNPKAETTHNEASISWDAVDGATSYWVKINNNFVYEGTDTFFTAKGLGDDRPYTVYIYAEAKSSTGKIEGEPATLFIVTKKIPVVLDKPANLVANPKATYVKLTWNAVAGATEYIVKQGQSIVYQGPLTVFTDVELESGTTYDYTVVASNGTAKSEEATVSATTLVNQLPYPVNLRITNLEWNYIRLDWDAVEGADEYLITRNGMSIGVPMGTWWDEDLEDIMPGATYTYKVAAYKGGVLGKEAVKVVTIPTEPIEGQAPEGNLVIKANRVEHSRVGLSWTTVAGATYYDVYQDGENLVYHGPLNTITDPNVGPQEQHTYKVVAGNQWGTLDSNVIDITTPAAPQSIVIAPSKPMEGTITFNYKIVEGAVMYVERNPQTKATPVGDGTYHVTYYNSATGETRDEGIETPVNGMLQFSETGVDPGKNYHYDIIAVILKADGTEEVVAKEEVSVITPADGSGVTVPGTIVDPTNPGTGGTTPTTPPSPPVTGGGNTGGSSSGGTTTQPTVDDKDSVPGTVVVPGTDDGTVTVPTAPETNFSDISGNFAEEAIKNLTASGVLKGYADGTFGPNKKITRAEFAIMAKRALGYTNSNSYVQEFKDFKQNAWYAEELLTALDSGITKGFTDGTYRPDVFIPREQAAVMIANVLEKNNLDTDVNEKIFMDDRDIIEWAKTSVYLLKTHKIVEGQNNLFYPKREITRAEAAVMIDRMLNLLNK
ncbi:S-layer homology domain-containing protein [Paenibacillus sp. FSL R7-0026]|uniref:S-layer homology domain-containing protein n=1 Tax=Paenibacillus sp. FSL R7-0026 TaxID=2921668 RepID=UPI0030FC5E7E